MTDIREEEHGKPRDSCGSGRLAARNSSIPNLQSFQRHITALEDSEKVAQYTLNAKVQGFNNLQDTIEISVLSQIKNRQPSMPGRRM